MDSRKTSSGTAAVLVLGSVNTDLVIRGPRLPKPSETVPGGTFFESGGGKGANQAVAAARAGAAVTFLAAVGNDSRGKKAIEALRAEGINVAHVWIAEGQPTGVALILVDEQGENMISVAAGANGALGPDNIALLPEELFQSHRVLLASLESPAETVVAALRRAKSAGMTTILNPAPADMRVAVGDVLSLVDVLTPNRGEAALLAGRGGTTDDDDASAARALCDRGCRACVVTLGSKGCLIVQNAAVSHLPAMRVRAIDATAAGDAFNGALAVGLAEGRTLAEAAWLATAAAAISVTRLGAQPSLPRRGEVDAMLTAK